MAAIDLKRDPKYDLIDLACNLTLSKYDRENFRRQGRVMFALGLSEFDAQYPNDTRVGLDRLDGWREARQHSFRMLLNELISEDTIETESKSFEQNTPLRNGGRTGHNFKAGMERGAEILLKKMLHI